MSLSTLEMPIDASQAGRTVASVLREKANVSWRVARGIVQGGHLRINGLPVSDPAQRLKEGDRIDARFDPATRYREKPRRRREAGFHVIHEDADLIVVDKDAGVLSVPTPTSDDSSLADRLLQMYRGRGIRQERLWIVHRIDRFTSGLVLFARTPPAAAELVAQFSQRTPRREYVALCDGVPAASEGRLVSRLQTDTGGQRVRLANRSGPGRTAISRFRVEERFRDASLLRVMLETGRRNQIRVQMAEAAHPVMGDRMYGVASTIIDRPALHAERLGFRHPRTGLEILLHSPIPADMRRAIARLRRDVPGRSVARAEPTASSGEIASPEPPIPPSQRRHDEGAGPPRRHGKHDIIRGDDRSGGRPKQPRSPSGRRHGARKATSSSSGKRFPGSAQPPYRRTQEDDAPDKESQGHRRSGGAPKQPRYPSDRRHGAKRATYSSSGKRFTPPDQPPHRRNRGSDAPPRKPPNDDRTGGPPKQPRYPSGRRHGSKKAFSSSSGKRFTDAAPPPRRRNREDDASVKKLQDENRSGGSPSASHAADPRREGNESNPAAREKRPTGRPRYPHPPRRGK